MTIKTCSTCKRRLETTEFNKDITAHDGLRSQCKSCTKHTDNTYYDNNKVSILEHKNIYQKGRGFTKRFRDRVRAENKDYLIDTLKIEWKCALCGFDKYPEALDFHHINKDEKKNSVGILMGKRDRDALVTEVNKCVLLCANCHRHAHNGSDNYYD